MDNSESIDVIAQRQLTFGDTLMFVKIARPEENGDDFICEYFILSKDQEKVGHAIGMDSMQALLLALTSIEFDLKALSRSSGQEITWLDDMPGYTGFSDLRRRESISENGYQPPPDYGST